MSRPSDSNRGPAVYKTAALTNSARVARRRQMFNGLLFPPTSYLTMFGIARSQLRGTGRNAKQFAFLPTELLRRARSVARTCSHDVRAMPEQAQLKAANCLFIPHEEVYYHRSTSFPALSSAKMAIRPFRSVWVHEYEGDTTNE